MRSNRSVMRHNFGTTPAIRAPRSQFDRSHGVKTSFDADWLIPFYVDEVLPGDTFNLRATILARLATPEFPIMDNMYLDTMYFFVPNRLLWVNWEKFQGAQDNPGDSVSFTIPQMVSTAVTGYLAGSLHDYFGLPTEVPGLSHSSLWHRAHNRIYNDWIRDENLQGDVVVDTDNGADDPADYVLLRRGKRLDYITGCLPWPQKGDAVSLPLGTSAPVTGDVTRDSNALVWLAYDAGTDTLSGVSAGPLQLNASSQLNDSVTNLSLDPNGGLSISNGIADLSTATAATINQLRQAEMIQELLERDARGGTRYVEALKSRFGVTSPDFRLQRSEYLGGGSQRVNITPVPQTSVSAATPQGNLAGFGTCVAENQGFVKSFTEHGVIIGFLNVRADLTYQQNLEKMWSRSTRYDFYEPVLANLGEQAVLKQEVEAVGTGGTTDDDVFGYQERWSEYRFKSSKITGVLKSNYATSLDAWHLSQDFAGTPPSLNAAFIVSDTPVDRAIVVTTQPHFIADIYINLKCARPMPVNSIPSLTRRF